MSTLVSFYFGIGPDGNGRMLAAIHNWDHDSLEHVHDYIQWLFPLAKPSQGSQNAPVLTTEDIEWFRTSRFLRRKLLASFELMLEFLGFELSEDDETPSVRRPIGSSSKMSWLGRENHNMLRITRILKSMTLLGLRDYAEAFLSCLEALYQDDARQVIGLARLQLWRDAVASR
jgi:hypothetical protein